MSGDNVGKACKSGKSMGIIFGLEFAIIALLSCLLLLAIALKSLDSQHPCSKMSVATKVMALNACTPLKSSQAVVAETSTLVMEKSGKSLGVLLFISCDNNADASIFLIILLENKSTVAISV